MPKLKHGDRPAGTTLAYAFRSGLIGFIDGPGPMPDGALWIVSGAREQIHELVAGNARRAYDNETLLVPGVPEAQSDPAAYEAFRNFHDRIHGLLAKAAV
jgi:hypothetical protein